MFPADFKELLSVFHSRKIRYLVIGGYAVIVHSQPRATKDLDLLIGPGAENAEAVYAALAEFGAPLQGLTAADFMDPGSFFRMGAPPLMVDILPAVKGVDYQSAWEARVDIEIDTDSGLRVSVISASDLIRSKLAAGRPQDLADVGAIREANRQIAELESQQEEHGREPERERYKLLAVDRARRDWPLNGPGVCGVHAPTRYTGLLHVKSPLCAFSHRFSPYRERPHLHF